MHVRAGTNKDEVCLGRNTTPPPSCWTAHAEKHTGIKENTKWQNTVDERKAMVGLVQVHVCRLVIDLVGDGEICFIMEDEGRGLSCCGCRCPLPFGNPFILLSDLVVD